MADYLKYYRDNLSKMLVDGELLPPWAKYPDIERYSIGWRMGGGESYLCYWQAFTEEYLKDANARLSLLRRHPAPHSWADYVEDLINPQETPEDDDDEDVLGPSPEVLRRLSEQGLVKSDIAFETWCAVESYENYVPWLPYRSPMDAIRYDTRNFYFWARRNIERATSNQKIAIEEDDAGLWSRCISAHHAGKPTQEIVLEDGLHTLAIFLFADARPKPPWTLGLMVADYCDSFELDTGYVDAFLLWTMSAFDDTPHIDRYLSAFTAPTPPWSEWLKSTGIFSE